MALRFGEDGPAISYDYSIMLDELKEEIADGILTLDDEIKVVRADRGAYFPIVDWFYVDDEDVPEEAKAMRVGAVLDEMETMNCIL